MKVIFAGYPAHATAASELPAPLFAQLKTYALALSGALISTQLTRNLINLLVEGHSDFDAQGRAFELTISQQRADNCRSLLVDEVANNLQAAFIDLSHLKRLTIVPIGWGTNRPVFAHPSDDSQRQANRRVEITFAVAAAAPVIDDSVQRALTAVAGLGEGGRKRRLTCMLTKLRDVRDVADGYPDFDEGHRVPGSAGFPQLSPDQWVTAINGFVVHVKPQVVGVMNGGSVADQQRGLLAIDDNIGRNIFNWTAQLNAGGATGIFDQVVIAFIQNQMANQKSVLSCYAGYSRTQPDL